MGRLLAFRPVLRYTDKGKSGTCREMMCFRIKEAGIVSPEQEINFKRR